MKNTKLVNINVARKFVAFLSAILVACLFMVHPVFAAETEKPVEEETTEAQSVGSLIAVNQAKINGSGTVVVHLDSANWWPDFHVNLSGGDGTPVTCSLSDPNGHSYFFGTLSSDGSIECEYLEGNGRCPAGDYTFYMQGSTNASYYALCQIYD